MGEGGRLFCRDVSAIPTVPAVFPPALLQLLGTGEEVRVCKQRCNGFGWLKQTHVNVSAQVVLGNGRRIKR